MIAISAVATIGPCACSGFGANKAAEDAGVTEASAVPAATYPIGPYGWRMGDTIPNVSLDTRLSPSSEWKKVPLAEYFDPFGKKGFYGLVIEVNRSTPASDTSEDLAAKTMTVRWPVYGPRGAVGLELLSGESSRSVAEAWASRHNMTFG